MKAEETALKISFFPTPGGETNAKQVTMQNAVQVNAFSNV